MNFRQKVAVAILDVLVIVELGIGIYFANQEPENFTVVFFKVFLSAVVPTLVLARVMIKRLGTNGAPGHERFE